MTARRSRKTWVNNVVVSVHALETRLDVAAAGGLGPDQQAAANGARRLLKKAEDAATGIDPKPGFMSDWWSGHLVEAAYQNLHAARAQAVDVYDDAEMAAEIPATMARAQQTMNRDDPRRLNAEHIAHGSLLHQRAFLRRAIEDSYDALDRQHERLRSFRNIVLTLALFILVLVLITIAVVWSRASIMPLCFPVNGSTPGDPTPLLNCPTGSRVPRPDVLDISVVALLGVLGGALAAAVSIRNLRGSSTPYDVPVALALLKVPLGAFTAILGLVAIRGEFVPGLSSLDSQPQILAYALVLGYAQQVFTRSLDARGQTLLDALPGKDANQPLNGTANTPVRPVQVPVTPTAPPGPAGSAPNIPPQFVPAGAPAANGASATTNGSTVTTNGVPPPGAEIDLRPEPTFQPPPVDEVDDEVVQDDGSTPLPNVPIGDHR